MDYGLMLSDSFAYAKGAVWGNARRWFLLLVSVIIFPFILGYMVRIFRGTEPAPELDAWGDLFVDGLKLLVIELIYAAPVILLVIIAFLPLVSTLITALPLFENPGRMTGAQAEAFFASHPEIISALGTSLLLLLFLLLIAVILAIIITIFSFIGAVRFARTGSVAEAFNFSGILATIRKIGWINYLAALAIIFVVGFAVGIAMDIVMMIPVIGFILWFFLSPPFIIFMSRYESLVYDAGEGPAAVTPEPN